LNLKEENIKLIWERFDTDKSESISIKEFEDLLNLKEVFI
jgi:hypothetical protein